MPIAKSAPSSIDLSSIEGFSTNCSHVSLISQYSNVSLINEP